jgi:hypothetical protein
MAVSREEAKNLALAYVSRLDLKGFRYEFVGISASENYPDEWGAVFDIYSPTGFTPTRKSNGLFLPR